MTYMSELIGEQFTEMPAAFFSSKVTERGHEGRTCSNSALRDSAANGS